MPQVSPTLASSPNFKVIFDKALNAYKNKTRQNIKAHYLFTQLATCDSPTALLAVLQVQVDQFNQSRGTNERLKRWLGPTINVLYAFSATLGEGVGLVRVGLSVEGSHSDADTAGIFTRKSYFCWLRCPPLGK